MVKIQNKYFSYVDNFAKFANTPAIPLFLANLDYVPKVTIAIPTYKRPDLLKDAIDSALNQQDFNDYEVIVVDNNPQRGDETELLLSTYSNNRLSYYKNSGNIGLYGNWNRCFELAKGNWVTLLHDDDFYFPEFLKVMYSYVLKYPKIKCLNALQYYWYQEKHKDEHISKINVKQRELKRGVAPVNKLDMFCSHVVGPVGFLYSKNCVFDLGGFNPDMFPSADALFHASYVRKFKIFKLNRCLVHYRKAVNVSLKPKVLEETILKDYLWRSEFASFLLFPKIAKSVNKIHASVQYKLLLAANPDYNSIYANQIPNMGRFDILDVFLRKYLWWIFRYKQIYVSSFNYFVDKFIFKDKYFLKCL